jgi:lysozyme
MTDREKLLKQLILHEGKRNKPYVDTVGKVTIAVGRNLTDVGLSDDEIEYLLNNDVKGVCLSLDKHLPWWNELDDIRQRVLIDMCFNMGIDTLLEFRNTLQAIKDKKWRAAADGMMASQWAKQVKGRAVRLSKMMLTGQDYV